MVGLKMLLSPISLTRKANILKIGGSFGGAIIATLILEAVAQVAAGSSNKIASFGAGSLPVSTLPVIGAVTIKDVPSMIPAIAGVITIANGRTKVGALMVAGSVIAKAGIRAAGYNPDEIGNKIHGLYDKYFNKNSNLREEYEEQQVYF